MRRIAWFVGWGLAAAAAWVWVVGGWVDWGSGPAAARAEEKAGGGSGGPPPLVVDKSRPLLLLEEPSKPAGEKPEGPVADNSACYVCHGKYDEEALVLWHAKADVGCMKCHGESFAHREDEDNVTPPDVMYPPEEIDSACKKCHESHEAWPRDVVARWQERCAAKEKPDEIVCTDCHGEHRMKLRTVRWDKKTRKLIVRPEGHRTKVAPDPTKKKPEAGEPAATPPPPGAEMQ